MLSVTRCTRVYNKNWSLGKQIEEVRKKFRTIRCIKVWVSSTDFQELLEGSQDTSDQIWCLKFRSQRNSKQKRLNMTILVKHGNRLVAISFLVAVRCAVSQGVLTDNYLWFSKRQRFKMREIASVNQLIFSWRYVSHLYLTKEIGKFHCACFYTPWSCQFV